MILRSQAKEQHSIIFFPLLLLLFNTNYTADNQIKAAKFSHEYRGCFVFWGVKHCILNNLRRGIENNDAKIAKNKIVKTSDKSFYKKIS